MRCGPSAGGSGLTATGVITVRAGSPHDRAFVEDLGRRTLRDSVASFRSVADAPLQGNYAALLDHVFAQSHVLLVAQRDGRRAGFVLMLDTMPDEVTNMPQGFIAYMAVEPAQRRSGVASRLLAAAEESARQRGLPYMGLMVTEENAAARRLYERAGYLTERRLLCKPL